MYSLYQINWEATADKTFRGEDEIFPHLVKISCWIFGNILTIFSFILKLEGNIKFFPWWFLK